MEFEYLQTERLILRKITPEVMNYVFTHFSDSDLMHFLGIQDFAKLQIEKNKFEKGFSMFNKSFVNFIILTKSSENVIGSIGFHTWFIDHNRAEIGYSIFQEDNKRHGYMSEALEKVIEYGFKTMNLNRIEALIASYNTPSLKLLLKNNFKEEGCLKKHYLVNGVFEDSIMYALLKEEYNKELN